jgi:hypothetical protein
MSSDGHEYLTLRGSSAYSHFRLTALKESINAVLGAKTSVAKVTAVSGIWVYYVASEHGAYLVSESSPARKILVQLLGGAAGERLDQGSGETLRYQETLLQMLPFFRFSLMHIKSNASINTIVRGIFAGSPCFLPWNYI